MEKQNPKSEPSNTKLGGNTDLPPSLFAVQLGVWRVILERPSSLIEIPGKEDLKTWKNSFVSSAKVLKLFISDLRQVVNPVILSIYIFSHFVKGLNGALLLYFSSQALTMFESTFASGKPDVTVLVTALVMNCVATGFNAVVHWFQEYIKPLLKSRLKLHYKQKAMQAYLNLDLSESSQNSKKPKIRPEEMWRAFEQMLVAFDLFFGLITQMGFLINLSRGQEHGSFFILLCLMKPTANLFKAKKLWSYSYVVHANNDDYIRSLAMYEIATQDQHKQEVISGALKDYVTREYHKAQEKLEGTTEESAYELYNLSSTPVMPIFLDTLSHLPIIYHIYSCYMGGTTFSLASIATMQQTSTWISYTFSRISHEQGSVSQQIQNVTAMYEALSVKRADADELLPYPAPNKPSSEGMAVMFQNVSYKYPNSDDSQMAVKSVSFNIPHSSLVVIVGANGSGKSSLVKLLTNLNPPTSGTVLFDHRPYSAYNTPDLRKASALLTQDHSIFPVSISENISMGDPECEEGKERDLRVREAARLGGATEAINKLSSETGGSGWDKVIHPVDTVYSSYRPSETLRDVMDKIEKNTELSGGEAQRLAASRTFMRILSGKIKLLVVDEPTSAMDPEGEFELFESLRSMRAGKTIVFVTHRFGHLTKHADLILCMKDGKLVESGTHHELMETKNEYYKLYQIQANAFTETPSTDVVSQSSTLTSALPVPLRSNSSIRDL